MYLYPTPTFMYTASGILGIGAAVIWTAQGNFLDLQSDGEAQMSKNTGIFWCMFQCSLIIGTLYIYFAWQGVTYVETKAKNVLFTGLTILASIGCGIFLCLKAPFCGMPDEEADTTSTVAERETLAKEASGKPSTYTNDDDSALQTILKSIADSFKLLLTRNMILIGPLFIYSGFSLSFFSGIYVTSVGNTNNMIEHASMLGLAGVFIGIGQVLGGGIFVFGASIVKDISRTKLLISALTIHILAFFIVIANIPLQANIESTDDFPMILGQPRRDLALFTAFLLGLGDALINNVIYSTITTVWSGNSAAAFGLLKCLQSAASAISFAIADKMSIGGHLFVLVIFSISTAISFTILRRSIAQRLPE